MGGEVFPGGQQEGLGHTFRVASSCIVVIFNAASACASRIAASSACSLSTSAAFFASFSSFACTSCNASSFNFSCAHPYKATR